MAVTDDATILANLKAAWAQAAARLAEIDTVAVDERVRSMEASGFVSLDWNAFRAGLGAAVEKARTEYLEAQKVLGTGNIFTNTSGTVRG